MSSSVDSVAKGLRHPFSQLMLFPLKPVFSFPVEPISVRQFCFVSRFAQRSASSFSSSLPRVFSALLIVFLGFVEKFASRNKPVRFPTSEDRDGRENLFFSRVFQAGLIEDRRRCSGRISFFFRFSVGFLDFLLFLECVFLRATFYLGVIGGG